MPVADLTESELAAWGARFASSLPTGAMVTFSGDLGAGKTTLVRAIATALGVREPVTSPTYALVHEYRAPGTPVVHVDLYRLENAAQLPQIGWDDLTRGGATVLVEWPERVPEAIPRAHIALHLEHIADRPDLRRLTWPG